MSVNALVREIASEAENYFPSGEVAEQLGNISLVPIIGPSAVGKTTIIRAATSERGFTAIHGFTTRARRPHERPGTYQFLPHDEEGLQGILDSIHSGDSLVQVAVHPQTRHVYGTNIDGYLSRISMIDAMASSMEKLRELPFKDHREIGLVTDPTTWWNRIVKRAEVVGNKETNDRINEATFSLQWLLDQGKSFAWIESIPDQVERTTAEVVGFVRGEYEPNPLNRKIGEKLLKSITDSR